MQITRIRLILLLVAFLAVSSLCRAQPFDLIVPDAGVGDSLSTELRRLQEIERDMSIEKLNRPGKRVEALLELGELRLSQARLEEARRFFEMVLENQPRNFRANRGLAMIYYYQGEFGKTKEIFDEMVRLYPLSERLQKDLEKVRKNLYSEAIVGYRVREDNRGVLDTVASIEAFFPSFTYPKLSARYRFESFTQEEGENDVNTRIFSSTMDYHLDHRSKVSLTFAPETRQAGEETINGYSFHGITGTSNLHFFASVGRAAFKENLASTLAGLYEDHYSLSLFGEIHERSRILQSVILSDISDGNSRKRFSTELLYFVQRRGVPFLSLDLKMSQASYENQVDRSGNPYIYWTPSDYRSAQFTVSWERRVGSRWWWGFDTSLTANSYRNTWDTSTRTEAGAGFLVHLTYKFEMGRIYGEFGSSIKDYYRETRLGVFCGINF